MANVIKFKRGDDSNLPNPIGSGEPLWSEDLGKLYVGTNASSSTWVGAEIDNGTALGTSQTKLATQYAIKTYVDAQVDTADALSELADTDISTPADASLLLYDTGTSTWRDGAMSGDATIDDVGALTIEDDAVSNTKLANIAQGSVKVGGASNAPTDLDAKTDGQILVGDGTDVASVAVSGDAAITNAGVVTVSGAANFDLDGNVDSSTQASTWTLIDDNAAALSFDATDKAGILKLVSTDSGEKVTMSGSCEIDGDITVTGDMTVSGDTTTTVSETVLVEDPMVRLATGNAADTNDIGFYGKYVSSGTKYAGIFRDRSVTGAPWVFQDSITTEPPATGNVTLASFAPIMVADITGTDNSAGNGTLSGFDIDGGTWSA